MKIILEIIADLGYFILLLNVICFSKSFFKHGKAFRIFTIYLATMFLLQIVVSFLQYLNINNLFLSHFYFILQFVMLSFFYLNLRMSDYQKKAIRIGFAFCLAVLGIQYALEPASFFRFNLFEIFITSFLLIIYATLYLYNLLNEKKEFYFINLGILVYLFGSTVIFLAGNLTTIYKLKLVFNIWILNAILYVVYQLLILFEWKKNYAKQVTSKNE